MPHRLSRREFAHLALSAGAAAGLGLPLRAAAGMFVSLNGSLTRQMPWPDFVRLAGTLGYGGVDVNLAAARKEGVEATRALLREHRVRPGVAGLPLQFAAPDDAAFQEGLKGLPDAAAFAAAIGCPRMMAVLSPGSPTPRAERHAFVKARLTPIAEVLDRAGISLGLEFLGPLHFRRPSERAPHQYIWTLPETVALAAEIAPNVGVVLDVWHWHHSGGTVADILATPRPRIVHIHLSDAKAQPAEEVRDNARLMPGEGVIDITGFLQALHKVGYDAAISPEPIGRVPPEMSPEEGARLGLETTTAAMKKAGVPVAT